MKTTGDKITHRIYIKGNLRLISPITVGSGESENSDSDLIKDWAGIPFIPASSIAGALRHYLDELLSHDKKCEAEKIRSLFGEHNENSTLSPISFYDAFPLAEITTAIKKHLSVRDGVQIDRTLRTAVDKHKFEFEVLEPGIAFQFCAEVAVREKHDLNAIKDLLYHMLSALSEEKIRFGAKTARGYGKTKLEDHKILLLDMAKRSDAELWLAFSWETLAPNYTLDTLRCIGEIAPLALNTVDIRAEFLIPYSLLIRQYIEEVAAADSAHINCQGRPVITGSTWAGCLTSAISQVGKTLGKSEDTERTIKELFGYVKSKEEEKDHKKRSRASRVIISESIVADAKGTHCYTRNRINRFTAGVVQGALFTEAPSYGGNLTLELLIKDPQPYEIGLLLLAIRDMGNGIAPIGGAVSIGRGILKLKMLLIDGTPFECDRDSAQYMKALAEELSKPEGGTF